MFRKNTIPALLIIAFTLSIPLHSLHFARWYTTMGNFTATLRDEIVPITANNFIDLTNDGFYDGLHFHRVVEGFVIQDGCPLGTGFGGPGYTIQDEFSPLLHHDSAGVLAMARTSAPNSAGSQYYITLAPTPHLDGNYAIFGKVFEGLDVVMAIGSVEVDNNDHPITNVYIDSLRILDLAIYSVTPNPDTLVQIADGSPRTFVVEAFNDDMSVQISWFIDDVLQPQATDIMFEPVFLSFGMHTVKCITTTAQVSWTTLWQVEFQGLANDDAFLPTQQILNMKVYPNPFRHGTRLEFNLTKSLPVEINVLDLKGRLVTKQYQQSKTGLNDWEWDGKDEQGQMLPTGVYFIKAKTASSQSVRKAVLLK